MATKQGAGIAAKPPVAKSKAKAKAAAPKVPTNQHLLDQRASGDQALGNTANGLDGQISQSYSQPFDYKKYQDMAPVQGDYNNWVNTQMKNYNDAYDQRTNPVNHQQDVDFDQKMANSGIPVGSDLYNQQKSLEQQGQNDARTQAYASGQGQAVQSAAQLFDVGTQSQQNAYGMAQDQRSQPLKDYSALYGAQSPYYQTIGGQNNQAANQLMVNQKSPSGGGPTGGGTPPIWQQYGFSNPQEYDAYKTQQARDQATWSFQNDPQYAKPKTASPYAQLGGGLLGAGLQGWAASGFAV